MSGKGKGEQSGAWGSCEVARAKRSIHSLNPTVQFPFNLLFIQIRAEKKIILSSINPRDGVLYQNKPYTAFWDASSAKLIPQA